MSVSRNDRLMAALENQKFIEKFWASVEKRGPDECWPWKKYKDKCGYGTIRVPGSEKLRAPRVAYALAHGIPASLVCHSCDNPSCCNEAHLFDGTDSENIVDCVKKGRWAGARPHAIRINPEIVRKVREMRSQGFIMRIIASELGITKQNVSHVLNGRSWRHVE